MTTDILSSANHTHKCRRAVGFVVAAMCLLPAAALAASSALPHPVLSTPVAVCNLGVPKVILSWPKVTGSTSYSIFRNKKPLIAWSNRSSKQKSNVYEDAKLSGSGTYEYQIKAFFNNRYTYSNVATVDVSACSTTSAAAITPLPMPQPVTTAPSSPKGPALWGAYAGDAVGDLASFEATVGAPVKIQAYFVAFGDSFPKDIAAKLKGTGKIFLVFWEPQGSLDAINAGQWDSYMSTFAADAKAYGDPVLIAPYHEMNLVDSPWSGVHPGNSAAKLVQAWRHTHDVVATSGATNITWGWAVNQEPNPDTAANDIANYYPGDAYVDIVGVDGFNFDSPWQTFDTVFARMLGRLQAYHKPIYVFSIASAEGPGKAAWITDALAVQMQKYGIKAWVWFNANKEKNWLVNSDPASLAAFKSALAQLR